MRSHAGHFHIAPISGPRKAADRITKFPWHR
jgi:hypothetical protein